MTGWRRLQVSAFETMGIEYYSKVADCPADELAARVTQAVRQSGHWALLSARGNPRRLNLRFSELPFNVNWPDDITTDFESTGIYVVFHGGTRDMQSGWLEFLNRIAAELGLGLVWEEL